MSEKEERVGISVATDKKLDSMFEEEVKWDDLVDARTSTVETLIEQQTLLSELVKSEEDKINNDQEIFALVDGLSKTFNDLAGDINKLAVEHATVTTDVEINGGTVTVPKEFKKGVIDNNDDELAYLTIGSNYVAIEEKIGHITSTAYIDIYTKLKMDVKDLIEAAKEAGVDANDKGDTDGSK